MESPRMGATHVARGVSPWNMSKSRTASPIDLCRRNPGQRPRLRRHGGVRFPAQYQLAVSFAMGIIDAIISHYQTLTQSGQGSFGQLDPIRQARLQIVQMRTAESRISSRRAKRSLAKRYSSSDPGTGSMIPAAASSR